MKTKTYLTFLLCFFISIGFGQVRPDQFRVDNTPDFTPLGDAFYTQEDTTGGASGQARKIYLQKLRDSIIVPMRSELADSTAVLRIDLAGGGGAASGLDTIATIAALASYSGSSLAVYLQDHTKTYRGGSFTIKGGILRRVPSGTVDHVTIFAGSGGKKWKRDIDGTTYYPEWANVGSGITYSGVEIRNEADRVRAVSGIGGAGSVIVFKKGKIYTGQDVPVLKYEGQTFEGNGAALKCGALIQTTLTAGYTAGATVISVADTTGFRIGQTIVLRRGIGSTKHDTTQPTITAVGATTITFSPAFASNWGNGKNVTVVFHQVTMSTTDRDEGGIIKNLTFDGNRTQQNATVSWLLNSTISVATGTSVKVEYCHFKNARCENVITGTIRIVHSTGYNCGGSFAHFNASPVNDNTRYGYIDHCRWQNMNLNNPDSAGHSEAVIIFSSNTYNLSITNNTGIGRKEITVIDDMNYWSGSAVISHNKFWTYGKILEGTAEAANQVQGDIEISHNEFHSCGDIIFLSSYGTSELDYRAGHIRKRVDINNNNFINGKIVGGWVGLVNIQDNTFEHKVGYYSFTGWTIYPGSDSRFDAYINLQQFDRVVISGNTFEGVETHNDTLDTAIKFILGNRYDDYVYNPSITDYFYPQGVLVSGNSINNTRYGIIVRYEDEFCEDQLTDWYFTDNKITSRSESLVGALMEVNPGCVATGNILINTNANADFHALLVRGIKDDLANNFQNMHGGEATNNIIYGLGSSIRVGNYTNDARQSYYNALVMYNTYTGTYLDQTAGKSTCLFNTQKNSALLPYLTTPENPAIHGFQKDTINY